jgi:hypothetical protein
MHSDRATQVIDLAVTILVGLGPLLAADVVLILGALLSASLAARSDPAAAAAMFGGAACLAFGAASLAALLGAVEARHPSFSVRLAVLWTMWNAAAAALLFTMLLALGGMSMAAVDGVVTAEDLRRQSGVEALQALLPAQVFILPWCLLAGIVLHRRQTGRPTAGG